MRRRDAQSSERMPIEELRQHSDVLHLGHRLGVTLMERIKDEVAKMNDEQRVVFYSALLKAPMGCMRKSIGTEATLAILDSAKEYLING